RRQVVVRRTVHVDEDTVALRARQQRNVLVGTVTADPKRIDRPGCECLAAPVQRAEMLARPEERLVGLEPGRQPAQAASVPGREVVIGAADVAILWFIDEAHIARRVLEAQPEGGAIDLER